MSGQQTLSSGGSCRQHTLKASANCQHNIPEFLWSLPGEQLGQNNRASCPQVFISFFPHICACQHSAQSGGVVPKTTKWKLTPHSPQSLSRCCQPLLTAYRQPTVAPSNQASKFPQGPVSLTSTIRQQCLGIFILRQNKALTPA